jgi:hypothetical protein
MKIACVLLSIAVALLSLPLAPATAFGAGQPLDIWTLRNPLPTGNRLNGVTHGQFNGNTLWVAVGVDNTILTSSDDGNTWQPQLVPPSYNTSLSGVICGSYLGAPLFVAVGSSATNGTDVILTSPDGINWTANAQSLWTNTLGLDAVAYGGGYFMAVGFNGENYYSSDGTNWTPGGGLVYDGDGDANSVAYGIIGSGPSSSPGFVAACDEGISTITLTTLTTSGIWTQPASAPSVGLYGVTYNSANGFVAVGYDVILNSPDGVNWYESTGSPTYGSAVVFGNNEFVAVNNTAPYSICTSPGGALSGADTWTINAGNYAFDAIDWDGVNLNFVAVGPNGTVANSYNGTNWQPRNSSVTSNTLNAIAYGANLFVAVGANGTIVTSANGINWIPVIPSVTQGSLNAITYGETAAGDSLFVAGGTNTAGGPAVLTSPDGSSDWSMESSLTNVVISDGYLSYGFIDGLVCGAIDGTNEFVALVNISADRRAYGGSVIVSASDGTNWSGDYETSIFNLLNGIAYGANGLGQPAVVAVGNSSTTIWSTDLHTWTSGSGLPGGFNFNVNAVAYGSPNNTPTFVAVGEDLSAFPPVGFIYTSTNGGQTWQQATLSGAASPFSSVTFANGFFVATTAESDYGAGGNIWVSPDGANWTQTSAVASGALNAVAGGDYQYIAVGSGGDILGSVLERVSGASLVGGIFTFTAYGPPGTEYGVYVSTNLATWNFLENVSIPPGATSAQVNADTSVNYTQGYYYLGPPGP